MTEAEAIKWLRLENGSRRTMSYYRDKGMIRGVRIGRNIRYHIDELRAFVKGRETR